MRDRPTDGPISSHARLYGENRNLSVATVVAGGILSGCVYAVLLQLAQPFPAVVPTTLAGVFVYGVVVCAVVLAYDANRGLVPAYVMAYLPIATANFYDFQFHVDAIVDTPGGLVVYGSLYTTTVYWVLGLLSWVLLSRCRSAYRVRRT